MGRGVKQDLNDKIDGVLLTPLKVIDTQGGDVLHGMKVSDKGYFGFGEAYFSMVERGAIKGWKRHKQMTLNLIIPKGAVRFVLYDDRPGSMSFGRFQQVELSRENYQRLTVPPMLWMAFQGIGASGGILLNIANIPHAPGEADRRKVCEIDFAWNR